MPRYLLDTNVVLRLSNPSDAQHGLVTDAISTLLLQGDECWLTAQILIELWVVATRPTDVNGLGWSIEQTRSIIDQLLDRFPITEEGSLIFTNWLTLVTDNRIKGKRTHDARIASVMLASDVNHILTLNPKDFAGISNITVVQPHEVVETAAEDTDAE
ncbi:MAG: type II toxin-antitoxin system VapC family toxin [Thermosynechococcaceae cyanobacterium]